MGKLPYKLPETEISEPTGQSTLDDLNHRITEKATDTVQKRMTPDEKKELNLDAVKYAKAMADYEEHMRHVMMGTGGIGLDDPPPNKPASLVKYEKSNRCRDQENCSAFRLIQHKVSLQNFAEVSTIYGADFG